ncbi:hypothetical protein AQJ91_28405 [Streptomyces dysideae]|uniref:Uncharacterized protein n=1 Tax=Streptomyces dysideae TaxID=909626 RepID=A0A101UVX6_9ACTN|nr:hypothetical protein AQJ91_28405 [Streptomyces dysideae]
MRVWWGPITSVSQRNAGTTWGRHSAIVWPPALRGTYTVKTRVTAVPWANSGISTRVAPRSTRGPRIRDHRTSGSTTATTDSATSV